MVEADVTTACGDADFSAAWELFEGRTVFGGRNSYFIALWQEAVEPIVEAGGWV